MRAKPGGMSVGEPLQRLERSLADLDPGAIPAQWLEALVAAEADRLPLPGTGQTLLRWQALARVASFDLSLAKLYEGHTDALAILEELGDNPAARAGGTWGVYASESRGARVEIEPSGEPDQVRLQGLKRWCSGAATGNFALLTAWRPGSTAPQLVRVDLRQPGLQASLEDWHAVGMASSGSADLNLQGALGQAVGNEGAYLSRPGFWHGGAGIAACWWGGALALARPLRMHLAGVPPAQRSELQMAALGVVDVALQGCAAVLREAAAWIDAHPQQDARCVAVRARLAAESTAQTVLAEVGQALGATPYARDACFARAAADLPVFLRQSHGRRDAAGLAQGLLASEGPSWALWRQLLQSL